MKTLFNWGLWLLVILLPMTGISQSTTRQNSNQNHGWYSYFGNHKLTSRWGLHTEYQWRRADWVTSWQQSLARVGVDYKLNPGTILSGGYCHIITYPYGDFPVSHTFVEHRLWQTLTLAHQLGKLSIQHRYRLEQRWLENTSSTGEKWIYLNRVRYRFLINIPLNKPVIEKGSLFFSGYDEVFINFGKSSKLNLLDQNRIYWALGFQFSLNSNVQLGYLNQIVVKSDGVRIENNHTLMVSLMHNFDFRKTGD